MKDNTLLFGALGVAAYLLYSMSKAAPAARAVAAPAAPAPVVPAVIGGLMRERLAVDYLPAEHAAPQDFMNPFLRAGQTKGVY